MFLHMTFGLQIKLLTIFNFCQTEANYSFPSSFLHFKLICGVERIIRNSYVIDLLLDTGPSPVHGIKPLWVTKWVDYSNKYGFGFQLSDKSVGVLFNDTTRMLLSADGK